MVLGGEGKRTEQLSLSLSHPPPPPLLPPPPPPPQAFLIAFTSDFLPRLYYRYNNHGSLHGFVNFTLATSAGNLTSGDMQCRYLGGSTVL